MSEDFWAPGIMRNGVALERNQRVRGRPFSKTKRVTGHVLLIESGWIVYVETLPNAKGHTRIELCDIANIEVLP